MDYYCLLVFTGAVRVLILGFQTAFHTSLYSTCSSPPPCYQNLPFPAFDNFNNQIMFHSPWISKTDSVVCECEGGNKSNEIELYMKMVGGKKKHLESDIKNQEMRLFVSK